VAGIQPGPQEVMHQNRPYFRSHYLPRTAKGKAVVILLFVILALGQPPIITTWANRIEPTVISLPFLYVYLFGIYVVLVVVLIVARWNDAL
jgi:hypothetical protein